MAGLHSVGTLTLLIILNISFQIVYSTPENISLDSVPKPLIQSAIDSLNNNSPTQHTYRGGNLISAQKLLEPHYIIFRLTLNLDTVCDEGLSSCPREACMIDLKVRSEAIEINRNSIQCMYLYTQQEDVQQVQQVESVDQEIAQVESSDSAVAEDDSSSIQNTLKLNHEVEATVDSQGTETDSPDTKPFIAVRAPNSKYCPGCPYELNPNLPGLAAFGAQALDVMDRLGHNDFKHKLIRIIRVTRAVPPGSNVVQYELLAEIGETNCLKTTLIERSQCSLQGNIPVKVCLVIFEERPWQQSDRQVVANNCTVPSELENEVNAALNPVLNGNSYLVGNRQPERVDSVQEVIGKTAHIDQLAQEGKIGTYDSLIDPMAANAPVDATAEISVTEVPFFEGVLPKENSESDISARGTNRERSPVTEETFVKVELARDERRQPVHGFIDKHREFDEFLSDFDIPLREPDVRVTEENRQPVVEKIIRPQRVGEGNVVKNGEVSSEEVASGESVESRNDRDSGTRMKRSLSRSSAKSVSELVQELAQKAADTLDDIDQDDEKRVVRRIMESKRHRMADGYLYHLVIEVALTECSEKNNFENDKHCLEKTIGPTKICRVQIHAGNEYPTLTAKVLKSECLVEPTKGKHTRNERTPGVPGGPHFISIHDKDVKNFTRLGLQKFSESFEGTNEPVLIEILNATHQVVAGSLYKIQVRLGMSDCPKGEKENCHLLADSETKECEISALSQPWLEEAGLKIKVECNVTGGERSAGDKVIRNRRSPRLLGAPSPISIEDEAVRNYASLGVEKLSETFDGPYELILDEILYATYQVVGGVEYKINVRLGTSNCPKGKKENCQLLTDSEKRECEVRVWSRPWLREAGLNITVDCSTNIRPKRGLKGKNYSQKMLEQGLYLKSERLFNDFIIKYNKTYSSAMERQNRLDIFHQNMMMVQELQRNEQGTAIYGASMFADLTTEEFKKKYLGLKPELRQENEIPIPMAEIPQIEIPDEYDWRNYNVVTPVKNQGACGSCWAFSVTGNVEGQYAILHGNLLSLSEQELVDCDTLDEGCNGGLPDNAYRAIEKLGGLEVESDYPYAGENEACHFNKTEAKVKVVSAVNITSNETQMAQWLVQHGPISIGINANAMQFYMGGVSHPFKFLCSPSNLDHGVLIVGYGTHTYPIFHKTLPYWTIKNSWGQFWGEQGYYRVYRGDGTCGVNQMASSAVVA